MRTLSLTTLLFSVAALLVSPHHAAAQDASSTQAAAPRITAPDIAAILDVAFAWFSEDPPEGGAHDPSTNGFNFQQLELALTQNIDPFFKFDANLVFSPFGVEVEEAYATTLSLPAGLQVRAGQMLTRFGRFNPTHPHSWQFATQVLTVQKMFGGEGNRGLGVELSWLAPLPWFVEFVGSATEARGDCCARSFLGADSSPLRSPADLQLTGAIKQFFPFGRHWSLAWGLSTALGPNATGNQNRTAIWGTDFYLRYRPTGSVHRASVSLEIEALLRRRQVPRDVLQDMGGYAQLVWQFRRQWATGARYEVVTGVEGDPVDPEWTRSRRRASAQLTFTPSHFSRIRLQGSHDQSGSGAPDSWSGILALEVVAGAHGSHTF